MFLGRYQQGDELTVPLLCTDGSGTPAAPAAPPGVMVYDASGAKLLSAPVPPLDRYRAAGLFLYRLRLGASYPPGLYAVALAYGGRLKSHCFEVVAGGDPDGAVASMCAWERPHARYLVQRTDGGVRRFGRNPSL